MKVLVCSSEVVPFAKTGGLADVAGALPLALVQNGVEARVAMPKYKSIQEDKFGIKKTKLNYVYETKIDNKITTYFIDKKEYFQRDGLYGTKEGDYSDNLDRFSYYCQATLDMLAELNFKPDIIHCNDWQSGLIPVYLKTIYKDKLFYKKMKSILTIHNIGYQGLFAKEEFPKLKLPNELFGIDGLEFYAKINFLKGAMVFSDFITTVSPTYSKEIQTKEFGAGLDGVLSKRRDSLFGIINGLDYNLWDPAKDGLISKKFSGSSLKDKYINKKELQKKCKLSQDGSAPLFGFVGRLAEQKGIDILSDAIEEIIKFGVQMVILGTGDQKYHVILQNLAKKFKKSLSVTLGFDNAFAHQIYAGSDFFLMPSRYEPCGLGQMISMKYASIPIAFKTGGLADTIVNVDPKKNKGNGLIFDEYSTKALLFTLNKAISYYKDKKVMDGIIKRALKCNFSWDESAKEYITLYEKCKSLV